MSDRATMFAWACAAIMFCAMAACTASQEIYRPEPRDVACVRAGGEMAWNTCRPKEPR